ncbi:MAG: hypothetical protein IKK33_00465 [Lachnospiraceae bacterium]|nr:hypothetical protein [Lachnospiraceae bacterium]
MREWPYAKEPFDTKLFVLKFIKKIHWVLMGMLIGAFLIGGEYYVKKVVFGGPVEYEITTKYYIEYTNINPETGELHNYINGATWKEWVVSDWFVDRVWQLSTEKVNITEKYNVQKEDLKTFFFADLPSDIRIPVSRVTTPYEELTVLLNEALQEVYFIFESEHPEMSSIEIIDETPIQEADKDVRLLRAIILGAVVGGFIGTFGVSLWLIWDDTITIPETFNYRYDIPMVGYLGKDLVADSNEIVTNIEYLFNRENKYTLLTMGEEQKGEELLRYLKHEKSANVLSVSELDSKNYDMLRQSQGILLAVGAGEHHGKAIEHVLEEMKVQKCQVKAAILYAADSAIIKSYRFGRKQK